MKHESNYTNRNRSSCHGREPYRLSQECWPEPLANDIASYKQWRVGAFIPGRPAALHHRPVTFDGIIIEFECFFGYLTFKQGVTGSNPVRLTRRREYPRHEKTKAPGLKNQELFTCRRRAIAE